MPTDIIGLEGGGVMYITRPGPTEVVQERSWGEHWCFRCRKRRMFTFRLIAEIELSYYGPWPEVRCDTCNTIDADVFPGREREWSE